MADTLEALVRSEVRRLQATRGLSRYAARLTAPYTLWLRTGKPMRQLAADLSASAEPTPAQKEAGNYSKRHTRVHGLPISVENEAGTTRTARDRSWHHRLNHTYGYIRGFRGADKDHIDVFLSPAPESSPLAYVVNQADGDGHFDEHKIMLGWDSPQDATQAYLSNYPEGQAERVMSVREMPIDVLKLWLRQGNLALAAYSDEQPRDEHGRFAESAGAVEGGVAAAAHTWLDAYVWKRQGPGEPTAEQVRALRQYVPREPVQLYRAGQAGEGGTGPHSWTRNKEFAEFLVEHSSHNDKLLSATVAPDDILVDTTLMPAAYQDKYLPDQAEVVVWRGVGRRDVHAEREYARDEHGRFAETEGGGETKPKEPADSFQHEGLRPGRLWPYGYWLTQDNALLDVSSDGGPGDHMGFLWAAEGDNAARLGVSAEDATALRHLYEQYGELEQAPEDIMRVRKYLSEEETGRVQERAGEATRRVLETNTRIVVRGAAGEDKARKSYVAFDTGRSLRDDRVLHELQRQIPRLQQWHHLAPDTEVMIEHSGADDSIRTTLDEFLTADHFHQLQDLGKLRGRGVGRYAVDAMGYGDAEWDEAKHPRDDAGKFSESGGGGTPAETKPPAVEHVREPSLSPLSSPLSLPSPSPEPYGPSPGPSPPPMSSPLPEPEPLPSGSPFYNPDPHHDTDRDGVTDASRVGVPGQMMPPPPQVPRLPNLTSDERQVEESFAKWYEKNPDAAAERMLEMMAAHEIGDGANIFSTDEAKLLSPDWSRPDASPDEQKAAKALYNTAVHQTANAIAKRAFVQYLDDTVARYPEGDPRRSIFVTAGGVGAGKGYALDRVAEVSPLLKMAGAIWDSAGDQNNTELPWLSAEAAKRGLTVYVAYVHADPKVTWDGSEQRRGVIQRAEEKGRMVDARIFADSYAIGAKNFAAWAQQPHPDTYITYIDGTTAQPKPIETLPDTSWDAEELYTWASDVLEQAQVSQAIKQGGQAGKRIWGKGKS